MVEIAVLTRPDEPVLTNMIRKGAQAVVCALRDVEHEATAIEAREAAASTLRCEAVPPWQTLGEQFSILEPDLQRKCLSIAHDHSNFSRNLALRRGTNTDILPGCLPMANAALAADAALRELRFAMVPARMSEEEFWRCYFWHVAMIKCELCHDWSGANQVRRQAKDLHDAVRAADEALLSADPDEEERSPTRGGAGVPSDAELNAEFDLLVSSPC